MLRYRFRAAFVVIAALFAIFGSAAAASAATGTTTANTASVMVHEVTMTAKSDNGVKPNIAEASCVGRPTWVHLYTTAGDYCYGFTGTAYLAFNDTYAVCWGNNGGNLHYYVLSNGDIDVTSVTITGWSGSNGCPL
jgi:hypothetical protein